MTNQKSQKRPSQYADEMAQHGHFPSDALDGDAPGVRSLTCDLICYPFCWRRRLSGHTALVPSLGLALRRSPSRPALNATNSTLGGSIV